MLAAGRRIDHHESEVTTRLMAEIESCTMVCLVERAAED